MRPGDVVLTFNFDVALERELKRAGLWEIGDGYGFSLGPDLTPPSKVRVLKLHGSTSWRVGNNLLVERPVVLFDNDLEYLGYPGLKDPQAPRQPSASLPSLIMPALNKRFYYDMSFVREWESSAARAIRIVWSMSFAVGDGRA